MVEYKNKLYDCIETTENEVGSNEFILNLLDSNCKEQIKKISAIDNFVRVQVVRAERALTDQANKCQKDGYNKWLYKIACSEHEKL
ncbi:MAG: hypothetical protein Rsou_0235 [Candidatus Ruthia sp. Asou_11_S2]|nr:hypothetical protein [Candidatus Ruthia sp. Asou_11_S2]